MDTANWIGGLMAEMTNQVQPGCFSLIPPTTIRDRYIRLHRYVLQRDERGRAIGYILHGAVNYGQPLIITQHAISYDKWLRGYGQVAFNIVLERAKQASCSSIQLRCAEDLPAVQFWQSLGFEIFSCVPGGKKRNRVIVKMVYPLSLPLLRHPNNAIQAELLPLGGNDGHKPDK